MLEWLFSPSCPCDLAAKAWVEERLQWLGQEFDDHAFNDGPVVLPTPEFFPDHYDGSKQAAQVLLQRVCGYMGVDPRRIVLKFTSQAGKFWLVNDQGNAIAHTAGTFGNLGDRYVIQLDTAGLGEPMELVGTMAHELAHARLLGEGRIDGDQWDNELLTDLTVVFLGLGIFLANTPRTWDSPYTFWPGTSLKRPEYMTLPMFGYALAHLAWFRGEAKPAWAGHLRWNTRLEFKQGLRYLTQTSDSAFRPARALSKGEARR
jgi:hypothetical protein